MLLGWHFAQCCKITLQSVSGRGMCCNV